MAAATEKPVKPLGRRAYGHIPHLPGSRMGPGDHHCHAGQAAICLEKPRDRHDHVVVQEKLDGSCVAVARIGQDLVCLGRAGYPATTSPFEQHHLFAAWAAANHERFAFLEDGERVVGEWLAQAHGTRYDLAGKPPFVAFDVLVGEARLVYEAFVAKVGGHLPTPPLLGGGPMPVATALGLLAELNGGYGALDPVEGVVYRVERKGRVDFLAKYVRPDKVDGRYLPEVSGAPAVWNWRPENP